MGQRTPSTIRLSKWLRSAVLCTLLFLADLMCLQTGVTAAADRALEASIHRTFGPSSYGFFQLMSTAGGPTVRVVTISLVLLALIVAGYRWSAALTLIGMGGAALLATAVKLLVGRPRPHLFTHVVSGAGSSFPSGHATSACAYAILVTYLVWHLSGRRGLTVAAGILLFAAAGLIGLSRVVLGVHYPSDVIGGYALGAAWACVCIAVFSPALAEEPVSLPAPVVNTASSGARAEISPRGVQALPPAYSASADKDQRNQASKGCQ